ncbi:L-amino-acid oxidase-like [Meriones unguiculatus]|uniref:L-amino-acid oxidase-like n=1 Tax=Meriones unguiculatus TaxID=10047 RepID=UPI000B4E8480|nr:L-amino-acid oxidase-like [Meriones unguiculatus]
MRFRTMATKSGILIWGILLSIPSCLAFSKEIAKCFQDPNYTTPIDIAQNGLKASEHPKHVVVVGAGMAGLVAAKLLQDAGHEVTILEASNYTGGRVLTYRNKEEGWYIELGAMRIPESHSLTHIYVKKLGLKLNKFNQYDHNTWYLLNGQRHTAKSVANDPHTLNYSVSSTEMNKTAAQLFHQAISKIKNSTETVNCAELKSYYDSYSTKAYLMKKGKLSKGAVQFIGDLMNEDAGFYKSFLESLRSFSIFGIDNESRNFTEITGGFDQLPNGLSAKLKPGTIHLESKVERVVRNGTKVEVSYRTAGPTSSLQNLTADYAIISASAKATRLITFQPPLSPNKTHALRSLHYTSATKVALVCNERFWEKEGIRGGSSITDRPSRFIYYPSHSLPGGKGMLLASYTVGDDSLFFLSMKDDQVVDIVLDDLAAVHNASKEELKRMCPESVIKQWSLDPLTLGAFAEFTPYQYVDYSEELFQPEGHIYFAGEHTNLPHGWIDTAIKSGIWAAKNIQDAVDKEAPQG